MITVKNLFLIFLFLVVSFSIYGQASYSYASSQLNAFMQKNNLKSHSKSHFGVIGNAYYVESFLRGKVVLKDSTVFYPINLRYNILRDQMEIKTHQDTVIVETPLLVKSFEFGEKKFLYLLSIKRLGNTETLEGGYFELLVDGEMQLLIRHEKKITNASDGLYYGGWQGITPNHFKHSKYFYIRKKGEEPYKFKLKTLKKISGKHYEKLQQYIDDEFLILKSQKDCMKLITYYNHISSNHEE